MARYTDSQTTELSEATVFRKKNRARAFAFRKEPIHGEKYDIEYVELNSRRKGYVVKYKYDGMILWLKRQNRNRYEDQLDCDKNFRKELLYLRSASSREKQKTSSKYKDYENHPLYGRRMQKVKNFEIVSDIALPEEIISFGTGGVTYSNDRSQMPFHLMEPNTSFLAIDMNINSVRRSIRNWKYRIKKNPLVEVDPSDGYYKMVIREFITSEEYDEVGKFLGTRVWCSNKIYEG